MGRNTSQDIGEPGLRIDAIHFGRDDEAVHGSRALSATIGSAEQPGFSAKSDPSQSSFGSIVRQADASVLEEQGKGRPALQHVLDRFGEVVPACQPFKLRAHVETEIVNQRPAQHPPDSQTFLGALAIDGSLDLEQRVDAAHDLDRDGRQRDLFLARGLASRVLLDVGHGEERAPGVHPTRRLQDRSGTPSDLIELVVPVIGVRLQDTGIASQMALRVLAPAIA